MQKKVINFIRNLLVMFIFFAVIGWIYEVIWTRFDDGVWTNRGFLLGPWLPIYGFGGLLLYAILNKSVKKPLYLGKLNVRFIMIFIYVTLATTVVELAATYIIELFGIPFTKLWDYSDHFMNFQGRVCLDASARFGILGLMEFYIAVPVYNKLVNMKNQKFVNVFSWILIAVFAIDWISRIWLGNNYNGPI